jgi:hypothetical protein
LPPNHSLLSPKAHVSQWLNCLFTLLTLFRNARTKLQFRLVDRNIAATTLNTTRRGIHVRTAQNRPQALHEAAECFPQYHQPASEEAEPSPRYSKPVYTSPPLITERAPASLTPPRYIPDAQKYSDETETLDEDDSVSCSTCEASTFEQSENIHPDLNRGRTCDRMGCRDRGKTPALHPYLRIWKHCKYGHFLKLPTGWVSVLSSSSNCDGIRPQHLPSLPDDIADHVDHNTRCVS